MGLLAVAPITGITRLIYAKSPKVALITDSPSEETIPQVLREASDTVVLGDLSWVGRKEIPNGADGALVWCRGEKPLSGTAADWRAAFFAQAPCDSWAILHWPCLEHADLLGLEPRARLAGAKRIALRPGLRLAGSTPSTKMKTAWRENREPWTQLSLAIWEENNNRGSGIPALKNLWQASTLSPLLSALVLRNLIVMLMRLGDWAKANELLDLGAQAFAGYGELPYLGAVSCMLQGKTSRAIKYLEEAMNSTNREFVGSGGEGSYRALFLLGTICDKVGQQEKAVNYWVQCINERPAFAPAVRALTQQQIPYTKAFHLQQPLGELARREPKFLEPILNFMLAHQMLVPARRLAETITIPAPQREHFLKAIKTCEIRNRSRDHSSKAKPGVLLSGPLLDASGHARTNREIGLSLLRSTAFDAALDSTTWPTLSLEELPDGQAIWRGVQRRPDHLDLTIRHRWPPIFQRPEAGKLVCILPWEHKAVPSRWVEEINNKVDQLWTPSEFVRQAFIFGGVDAERVRLLPNAVSDETFTPLGAATRPPGCRGFTFLFVGGAIRRKGIDLLLQAYGDAFTPDDDVTLVIKDLGARSFYRNITRLQDVQAFAQRQSSPHTLILGDEMNDAALAGLYRGANVLVHPYRGEGFGMPMVEAMACGKPIIATGEGPAVEFCHPEDGYLLPAREVPVPEPPPQLGKFSGDWTWFEPDVSALARTMRHVYEHPEEAARRGKNAASAIRARLTWKRVLPLYLERISFLTSLEEIHPPDSSLQSGE